MFTINLHMKRDFSQRFGFILTEAGRLYGRRFDQLARDRLGMRVASPAITDYVNVASIKAPAAAMVPGATASAPSAAGRVSGGRMP